MQVSNATSWRKGIPCDGMGLAARLQTQAMMRPRRSGSGFLVAKPDCHTAITGLACGHAHAADATGELLQPNVRFSRDRQQGDLRLDERLALAGVASDVAGRVASGSSYLHVGQGAKARQQRAGRVVLPCWYPRQGVSPRQSQRRGSREAAGVHVGEVQAAGASVGRSGCRQTARRRKGVASRGLHRAGRRHGPGVEARREALGDSACSALFEAAC